MKVLVIGATGKIGSEMVRHLQKCGIQPRLGLREPEKARKRFGCGPEYAPFDFTDPGTFHEAIRGISRLFFIAPIKEPDEPVAQMLETARKAGVRHITFSSGRTTGDIEGKPLNRVEKQVMSSNIPYAIIRPGWFMQNFTTWLGDTLRSEGKLYLPAGNAKTAFIDVRDIAGVAAHTLLQNGHENRVYNLTSDEAIDHHEVVRLIGRAAQKNLAYVPLERTDFIRTMQKKGWTETAAHYTADLYDIVRTGKEEEISPDVQNILRRRPTRFAEFTNRYRQAWK